MFSGYEVHDVPVCQHSRYKKFPCRKIACKHHVSHVKASQSGTEYTVYKREQLECGVIK